MRAVAVFAIILGLATLVFGALLTAQARQARQAVISSLKPPVTLENLRSSYEELDRKVRETSPSHPEYSDYFAERTWLGLAQANLSAAKMVNTSGIVDILIGLGIMASGFAILRKISEDIY
ncbi:MAG: hypothetical protein N2506_07630 [Dehalococcoidales bacterium]|nr:hypothetical protein [Dehalococcoidales bacterium]